MVNKIAILSDIHGNYEALKAVIEDIDKNNIDTAISLGDNIGYGPDPNLVVATLKLNNIQSVAGNHELAVKNEELLKWFNPFARESIELTREILTENTLDTISSYPEFLKKFDSLFVHGAPPDKILTYMFEISPTGLEKIFSEFSEKFCFVGHTHQLRLFSISKTKDVEINKKIQKHTKLDKDKRYIINSGSVGQPRDNDKRAKYLIFDKKNLQIEVRALDYNNEITKKKLIQKGFPIVYASML